VVDVTVRLILVGNRGDGAKGEGYDRACNVFYEAGAEIVDRLPLDRLDELPAWIDCPPAERPVVVAAGGDGTIGSVADRLADTEAVLGILPLGTSNDVARSLAIPLDITSAAHLILAGESSKIDVGAFIDADERRHIFVHAAALGLNVRFARLATDRSFRARLGPFTYLVAGALALRRFQPFEVTLTVDESRTPLRLLHLSVINAPVFGGRLELAIPGSEVDDRRLDVLAVENMPVRRLIAGGFAMLRGRRGPRRGVRILHVRHLHVHADTPLDVTTDGEMAGAIPGDFRLCTQTLSVITPRHFHDSDRAHNPPGEPGAGGDSPED
jgi:diacylglycerol kinase (ATP)